ncbi:T9SS type A sorting domain-containing protein [bacterium]|nr:T9SS type A sorting domain-containing protein [bacterium]
MNISKKFRHIPIILIMSSYCLISTGCEPDPKMIGYGSNEFSQLEFPGTSWNDEILSEGYWKAWAGGNFSIALIRGGGPSPSFFLCKGDSALGQCDIPTELNANYFYYSYPPGYIPDSYPAKMSLGLNHTIATILDTFALGNVQVDKLFLWGDNSLSQTNMPNIPDTVNIAQIAAGNNHNLILIGDPVLQENDSVSTYNVENKRLIAWGDNTYGQCNVPDIFNPLMDSIEVIKIEAGANHNLVLYDSSGVQKLIAWGDNAYNQSDLSNMPSLNENEKILDIFSGYNHNVVITYDEQIDFYSELMSGAIIDELISLIPASYDDDYYYYYYDPLYPTAHALSIHAWGDNTFGQTDVPDLTGIYEGLSTGGYHNSIVLSENFTINIGPEGPIGPQGIYTVPTNREIISWGKNDFGQTEFPIKYIFDAFDFIPDPSTIYANSPPTISSGENHNLVVGAQIYRAPSLNYNFLDQFNGGYGDTLYQTLILRNIGPDTLFLDSLKLVGGSDTIGTHPFYLTNFDTEFILYGDSASSQIYCVFDSAHAQSEYANLRLFTSGWFDETTNITLSSYFGPIVNISFPESQSFYGVFDETISKEVKIRNIGNSTVYIDSMGIRNGNSFLIEPLGDENSIESGDSLSLYVYTTLPEIPMFYNDILDLYISNFNIQQYSYGLNARRYHKVGDNISIGYNPNTNIAYCSQREIIGLQNPNYFSLLELSQVNTKIHHLDFGYLESNLDSSYLSDLHSLNNQFRNNPSFLNMVKAELGGNPFPGYWYFSPDSCDQFLNEHFPLDYNTASFQSSNPYFEFLFEPHVESVLLNEVGEITYIDTFNLDSITQAVELALNNCGINCIDNDALTLEEDTSFVFAEEGLEYYDTLSVLNTSIFDLPYTISTESGSEQVTSALFYYNYDNLESDIILNDPVNTISIWFKPLMSNWSDNPEGYTSFITPQSADTSVNWEIMLEDNLYPRIGFKYGNNDPILSQSPVWHLNDTWFHCVFVHDDSNNVLNVYKNGLWEATSPSFGDILMGDQLSINTLGVGYFKGLLAQTAVWNEVLSLTEISELYDKGPNFDLGNDGDVYNSSSNLVLYWKFNDIDQNVVMDHSGNNFHANLSGYPESRRHTSVLPTLYQWLFVNGSTNSTISGNGSNIVQLRIETENLSAGTYYGMVNVSPGNTTLLNSYGFIKLVLSENLSSSVEMLPFHYSVGQNFPNPFNPITEIKYELPNDEFVELIIYDLMGRNVKKLISEYHSAGTYSIKWNGTNNVGELVSAGMYFYTFKTNNFSQTRKMMFIK